MVDADPVEIGVELLARLEHDELSLPNVVDRIETITTDPTLTREILETAERRGLIARDGHVVRPVGRSTLQFESAVVSREGDFTCRRCGAGIGTGYFIRLDVGEHGPFGSSCIEKVTGRDDTQ